jgi:hypothetical protein
MDKVRAAKPELSGTEDHCSSRKSFRAYLSPGIPRSNPAAQSDTNTLYAPEYAKYAAASEGAMSLVGKDSFAFRFGYKMAAFPRPVLKRLNSAAT